jgi:hypothetical protein
LRDIPLFGPFICSVKDLHDKGKELIDRGDSADDLSDRVDEADRGDDEDALADAMKDYANGVKHAHDAAPDAAGAGFGFVGALKDLLGQFCPIPGPIPPPRRLTAPVRR